MLAFIIIFYTYITLTEAGIVDSVFLDQELPERRVLG